MKKIFKILAIGVIAIASFSLTLPAKAFYLEVPPSFISAWENIFQPTVLGEEESFVSSPEPSLQLQPQNQTAPGEQPSSSGESPAPTCRVNGVDMPGACEQYNKTNATSGSGSGQGAPASQGPSQQDNERFIKDLQRGAKNMENNLKRLEREFSSAEKSGLKISDEIKTKLKRAREMIDKMKNISSVEEAQSVDIEELQGLIDDLQQFNEETIMSQRRLQDIKKGMRGMEQGIKTFEKQLKKISAQKLTIPANINEALANLKEKINAIKTADSWEKVEELGLEDMQEMMNSLQENRQQLEMLARWPQTQKMLDKELANLNRELKKAKTIVNKLAKQGIDLNDTYSNFEAAISKLKLAKDEAAAKIKSGEGIEDAFDSLETEFYGRLEDTWQYQRIIQEMSNLGQFNANIKRELSKAQQQIYSLKKKKIDTKELELALVRAKNQAAKIQELLKIKPIDEEAVSEALAEMEALKQEFEDKLSELTGEEEERPWEQGTEQFNISQLNFNLKPFISEKKTETANGETGNDNSAPANEVQ